MVVFYSLVRVRMIGAFQGDSAWDTMINILYIYDRSEKIDSTAKT